MGKWYPGESLPRRALGCYWRKDGIPVWANHKLLAEDTHNYGHTAEHAARFIQAVAQRLGVDPRLAQPAYEDTWHHLWKEHRMPVNVDPLKANLKDPEERIRLARLLEQGLDKIVGYAMPLQPTYGVKGLTWVSGNWVFRTKYMYLTIGDSPMGLRLPLDSIPWAPPSERPVPALAAIRLHNARPWATRAHRGEAFIYAAKPTSTAPLGPLPPSAPPCASSRREGRLHVFMPPQDLLEEYIDLVAAVEQTAADLNLPVIIEGYTPPHDPRITHLKVTPDPGVIEVNTQPTTTWDQLVNITTTLYEEARQSRWALKNS